MQQDPSSPDRFKAQMPAIPGVGSAPSASAGPFGRTAVLTGGLGLALVVIGGIGWWAVHAFSHRDRPVPVAAESSSQPAEVDLPAAPKVSGPVIAASAGDLSRPWAAKAFTFVDPVTGNSVPAMVVHLAGSAPNSSESYWGFSLEAPFQTCQLQYITNLSELARRFDYHGTHPMVASPCDGTVYDPLRMGTLSSGAWARGEIVQGAGIRPPIAIEIKVEGNSIVADRIE